MGSRERGGAPIYLTFALAASIGAGVGVYMLIKQTRAEPAREAAASTRTAPTRAPQPRPEHVDVVAPHDEQTPIAIDHAEVNAVDPAADSEDVPSFGRAGVSDGLERDVIERVVRARSYRLRRCYEKNATAQIGVVRLRFFVDADGKVVQVSNMGIEDPVASCLDEQLRKMRFPKPSSVGVRVVFPIRFASGVSSGDPMQ